MDITTVTADIYALNHNVTHLDDETSSLLLRLSLLEATVERCLCPAAEGLN